jgi:hypothetical protein
MSLINLFTKKDNIKMLWDVVSDEDLFRFLTPDIQSKIYTLFLNNIQGFFENEIPKTNSLVDLNKKYILLILNHIKQTYPYQPSKIKIHNEPPVKELITFEEIQNDKKSQFEKDLSRRQEEFEYSMTIKAPPVPEFSDPEGKTDRPIKEMDKIIKEMQLKRNYEVEQINRTYNASNQVDNWLKPQETSLKTEKYGTNELPKGNQEKLQGNRLKFLNELDTDHELSPNSKKNVSFSNKDEIKIFSETDNDEDNNLFSRLKKVNSNKNNIENLTEQPNNQTSLNEDRLSNLERNLNSLTQKMDKLIDLLSIDLLSKKN